MYIPYIRLSEEEKKKIDRMKIYNKRNSKKAQEIVVPEAPKTIEVVENY